MKSLPCLSQRQMSLALSLYIGLALNSANLMRNAMAGGGLEITSALLSAIALVGFCYLLISAFSLFGQTLYKTLASFTLLVSAAASYYMIFFNVVIGYGVIVSTLTLDTDLNGEALGHEFFLWWTLTGIVPVVLLWCTPLSSSIYQRMRGIKHMPPEYASLGYSSLKYYARRSIPILCCLLAVNLCIKTIVHLTENQARKNNQYTASIGGVIAHSYLPTNWIASLAIYVHQLGKEDKSNKQLFDPSKHFTYQPPGTLDDLFVVFVIGETTRWDHMGLFGYERNTTPLLSQEPNLIALRGTSCDTATKLSLRCMFVRENGTADDDQRTLKERNVFAVMRKLGFTSELFGMQSEAWFYSSLDANSYEIREIIASQYAHSKRPIDDMLLVDQLEKSIHKYKQGKHLVVLHTKGSHHLYSQRYTREFARFTPECMDIDDTCSREQLVNSFDNTVLYVDHMLKTVFDKLRDKNALVFYVPDHGESIGENSHFHATPKELAPPEQFRVPFLVWTSDKFIAQPQNQQLIANLKKREDNNFLPHHEQIFDSLLGCIGYSSPDGGIKAQNNWCSDNPTSMAFDNHPASLSQR
ncbi:kdo(2)-lipid A phosphoethanolamine 7''-transferase [Cellvibrio sp. pealriver]|uniref:kdo(2)-lipid A phosphoethanolamine 7''-transferase n=1 Tax=Cellvibrio sp. pealriver TaxID=1622269 RepID=UPI00066FC90A|nr:kdo(2)-lipid A phosphoethanolamine 7''-transferase [Cellvibrio sp. pealriver]